MACRLGTLRVHHLRDRDFGRYRVPTSNALGIFHPFWSRIMMLFAAQDFSSNPSFVSTSSSQCTPSPSVKEGKKSFFGVSGGVRLAQQSARGASPYPEPGLDPGIFLTKPACMSLLILACASRQPFALGMQAQSIDESTCWFTFANRTSLINVCPHLLN
ncbi:hypothetical protein LX32DRAFT_142267 [Colletotrichum zoysiae]|uniref:Uncharacterized protein n=1 Tax=Colletotrichum zoysiae TaxID=1216348 RepID=A0AAD9H8Q6_9PEZI|nr:hypothetical protein LX32DRAFT_142267 [Colletotrichum zoysiae]